jgi:hypothetical protein
MAIVAARALDKNYIGPMQEIDSLVLQVTTYADNLV